ncbi:Protein of unknown function [Gryllus bimaculatus]|nr:Protein of unknown function [Gryllus bimaculatus]
MGLDHCRMGMCGGVADLPACRL